MMNRLHIITLYVILLTTVFLSSINVTYAGGANKKNLREIASDLITEYEKSGKTKFSDFHEQFIVLNYYKLPNIMGTKHGFELKPEDYTNPQKFAEYEEFKTEMDEQKRLESVGLAEASGKSMNEVLLEQSSSANNPMDIELPPMSAETMARGEERRRLNYSKVHSYLKEGYFDYFVTKLDKGVSGEPMVDVCVNLNWWKIGLHDEKNLLAPREQINQITNTEIDKLLASLEPETYANPSRKVPRGKFDCNIRMMVDRDALSKLNSNDLVASIIHPELVLSSRALIRTQN